MKAREIFKKVEAFNEVASNLGWGGEGYVEVEFNNVSIPFEDGYKDFKKFVKDKYIEYAAKAILEYDGYEFDKEVEVEFEEPGVVYGKYKDSINVVVKLDYWPNR